MATKVDDAFRKFIAEYVQLDPSENGLAKSSRDWLITVLNGFSDDGAFPKNLPERHIFFGSYSRKTKIRPLDDIDIMFCMHAEGCEYSEDGNRITISITDVTERLSVFVDRDSRSLNSRRIVNAFVAKLQGIGQYQHAEISRNLEAATLDLVSYDWNFDIVPCFYTTPDWDGKAFYLIPDGNGAWKKTDPRIDRDRLHSINNSHNGKVLDVIRLVKYWNSRPTMPSISSYLLECMLLDYFANPTLVVSDYPEINFSSALGYIEKAIYNPVMDPKEIQGDLNNLNASEKFKIWFRAKTDCGRCRRAVENEFKGNVKEAITEWVDVFGPEFEDAID